MVFDVGFLLFIEVILPQSTENVSMSILQSAPRTPFRSYAIADMSVRTLGTASQTSQLHA